MLTRRAAVLFAASWRRSLCPASKAAVKRQSPPRQDCRFLSWGGISHSGESSGPLSMDWEDPERELYVELVDKYHLAASGRHQLLVIQPWVRTFKNPTRQRSSKSLCNDSFPLDLHEADGAEEEAKHDLEQDEAIDSPSNSPSSDAHEGSALADDKQPRPYEQLYKEAELKMAESLALVHTLGWSVVDTEVIGTISMRRQTLFGIDTLLRLSDRVERSSTISAVFVSTYQLSLIQRQNLEEVFGCPVLDRHNVVLQIFQLHARTREARLQVALAEIPYLNSRLHQEWAHENANKHSSQRRGTEHFEKRDMHLKWRKKKIKEELAKISLQREALRNKRKENQKSPIIAVVGYTNCGKTSLIKAFTGQAKLRPRNQLFATLDVTVHAGALPSNLTALFVDTVGFISDIPATLIASFSATLEDAAQADMLIHVRDVSNPDHEKQNKVVLETLKRIGVPQATLDNMLTLGNKIDLIEPSKWRGLKEAGLIPISVKEGFGLDVVLRQTEQLLMPLKKLKKVVFRCKTGSPEQMWLYDNASAIVNVAPDEKDQNYSAIDAIISEVELRQFEKTFL